MIIFPPTPTRGRGGFTSAALKIPDSPEVDGGENRDGVLSCHPREKTLLNTAVLHQSSALMYVCVCVCDQEGRDLNGGEKKNRLILAMLKMAAFTAGHFLFGTSCRSC